MPAQPLLSAGDGLAGPAPTLAAESASCADDALQRRLEEARLLLRQAARLCSYHQPGLGRDIQAFLKELE